MDSSDATRKDLSKAPLQYSAYTMQCKVNKENIIMLILGKEFALLKGHVEH